MSGSYCFAFVSWSLAWICQKRVVVLDPALGTQQVGLRNRAPDLVQRDAVLHQGVGLQLDADRRQRSAADGDVADAGDLRHLLRQHRRGEVVHLAGRARLRGQRQDHDRRLRRVDLAVLRHARQGARQQRAAGVDGRLDLARGDVDVLAEVEHHVDARRSLRAVRGQLADPGDGAERALERRRHRRGHRLGAGPGQVGRDEDHREVDLRQRRHRQQRERHRAGEDHRQVEQRGRDRPLDERRREAHGDG